MSEATCPRCGRATADGWCGYCLAWCEQPAGDPPPAWGIEVVAEPHPLAPFLLCHEPRAPRTGHALCGHVHPGVRISGNAFESTRLPCFVLGPRRTLLPAFGRFTGLALIGPSPVETIVAIAGPRLFRLPRTPR